MPDDLCNIYVGDIYMKTTDTICLANEFVLTVFMQVQIYLPVFISTIIYFNSNICVAYVLHIANACTNKISASENVIKISTNVYILNFRRAICVIWSPRI